MLLAQKVKGAQLRFLGLIMAEIEVDGGEGEEGVGIGEEIVEEDCEERENGEEVSLLKREFEVEVEVGSDSRSEGLEVEGRGRPWGIPLLLMDELLFFVGRRIPFHRCRAVTGHRRRTMTALLLCKLKEGRK